MYSINRECIARRSNQTIPRAGSSEHSHADQTTQQKCDQSEGNALETTLHVHSMLHVRASHSADG